MPLPEGVSPDRLMVTWLADGEQITHNYGDPNAPDEWANSPLTYLPETNEVAFTLISLYKQGQVFVLVARDDGKSEQNVREFYVDTLQADGITLTAACSKAFKAGKCGRNQTNFVARAFRENFELFQRLGYGTPSLSPDIDGNYYITIEPKPENTDIVGVYKGDRMYVYLPKDGSFPSTLTGTIRHELTHAFHRGYTSISGHPTSASGAYFREGIAALSNATESGIEPSIRGYGGHRPLDISLFAPYVPYDVDNKDDPRRSYPYQAQEFWEALAKNSGAANFGFFEQFLAPTEDGAINALPAWDPRRVDHVIKNLDGDPFPGGLGDAYQQYVNDRLAAIIKNGERLEDNFSKINELETPDAEGIKISAEGIDPLSTRVFRFPIPKGKTGADFLLLDGIDGANVRTYVQDGYYYILVTNTSYDTLPTGAVSASSKDIVEPDVIGPANSHGEPHLRTFDFIGYDFQAIGEYVFTRSTLPEDDFEVQVRYIPVTIFEGSRGEYVSVAGAAAIRQFGDLLEVYAVSGGGLEVYVNAQEVTAFPSEQGVFTISKRLGSKQGDQQTVVVTTPDGKSLKFRGFKSRNASFYTPLISDIQVVLPAQYEGHIEGLLGNANGDRNDDLQLRDGTLLPIDYKEGFLYFGNDPNAYFAGPGGDTYRDSWSLFYGASSERFLRLGGDPFSRTYPRNVVKLTDLPEEKVESARQACVSGGIKDAWALRSCTFDVALTGDDTWVEVAKGVDLFLPSISLTPAYRFAGVDAGPFKVSALAYEDGFQVAAEDIEWSLAGPGVSTADLSVDSYSASFSAPGTPGIYTVTAKLRSSGEVFETSTFELVPGKLPAVANDDSIVTSWNMTAFLSVLFNDDNPDGRPSDLIIVEVTQPENGTAEISSDGKRVIYNPDPNYFGTDTLTYTIENGDGTRSTGTIRIRIDSFFAS